MQFTIKNLFYITFLAGVYLALYPYLGNFFPDLLLMALISAAAIPPTWENRALFPYAFIVVGGSFIVSSRIAFGSRHVLGWTPPWYCYTLVPILFAILVRLAAIPLQKNRMHSSNQSLEE